MEFSLTRLISRGLFAIHKNMDSEEKYNIILPLRTDISIKNFLNISNFETWVEFNLSYGIYFYNSALDYLFNENFLTP